MKLEIDIPSILYNDAKENRRYISVNKMEIAWKAIADGKPIEQEPIIDKIRAEIIKYECDCRLSVDEYPSCKQCTDNVFETIYSILDKYKAETEVEDGEID